MIFQKKTAFITVFIAAIIITIGIITNKVCLTSNTSAQVKGTEIPILLFHHIVQDEPVTNNAAISIEHFEKTITALHNEGYTAVHFDNLIAYTENKEELPDKPILITFDDGYESSIVLAKSILKKYNMQATVFVIGVSVGKTTYKDTGIPITPHFTWEQAVGARDVISVQSHSYDMHNVRQLDLQDFRSGVLRKESENETDYINAFQNDIERSMHDIQANLNTPVTAFAYPYGLYTDTSELLLKQAGIKATVTSEHGINKIRKGDPRSLYAMKRIEVTEEVQSDKLIKLLSN